MTLDDIITEAETFFEWESDRRDEVTFYSAMIFVQHCLRKHHNQLQDSEHARRKTDNPEETR